MGNNKDNTYVLDDRPPKYDEEALKNNLIKKIWPGMDGYDDALTYEEAMKKYGQTASE